MKKIITLSFILIFTVSFAQEKHMDGDSFFEKMEYLEAAKLYENKIVNDGISREVLQKIGNAYYFNTDMQSANKWYGKLIRTYKNDVLSEYFFRYAQSFKGIGKHSVAKKWMKEFLKKENESKEISVQNVMSSKKTISKQSVFKLKNLSINTMFSDFGPMYYRNKLIFSSTKDSLYFNTSKKINQLPFSNLYIGNLEANGTDVISSEEFSKKIKSTLHEATLCFSADYKKVYYTRNNYNKNGYNRSVNKLKIYSAIAKETENGIIEWSNFKELPFNSNLYSSGHPALSPDGKKLYFVSDMPGTIGKTDIFVVDILNNDKYSKPKNLGSNVNTKGKEMFPFLTKKKIYFASNGHDGFGGLDVFESEYDVTFELPVNLGTPLNSTFDDFGYIVKEKTNNGFVCSNRNSGKGDDDIYFFERTQAGICKQLITGYISNNITGERIANAKVSLHLNNVGKLVETQADINGNYVFKQELICNKEYVISVKKEGYKGTDKTILTTNSRNEILVPIGMERIHDLIIEANGLLKIKVGIIYFDRNKFSIRKDAALEFDKVISLLKIYPEMIINIESHTDSRGSDTFNFILSDKRAKAARDYIISKGISSQRIRKTEGFGETKLMNKCKNGEVCSESMHQLNRRSEFIIIKM